jgi:hypothetical protein
MYSSFPGIVKLFFPGSYGKLQLWPAYLEEKGRLFAVPKRPPSSLKKDAKRPLRRRRGGCRIGAAERRTSMLHKIGLVILTLGSILFGYSFIRFGLVAGGKTERARSDSNGRPADSKSDALSS